MKKKLRLTLPVDAVNQPIIYSIVTKYHLKPNILEANLISGQTGKVTLEIEGALVDVEKAILYLQEHDIIVETLE